MSRPSRHIRSQKLARLAAMAAGPLQAAAKPQVAISGVKARAVREPAGGRTYVIVSVETDAGVVGVGETTATPDPATAVGRILRQKSRLIGKDALAAEAVRQVLSHSSNASAGELAPVQAAVNMALLDVLGKITKAPVYEALGGYTRRKARALAPLHGADPPALRGALAQAKSAGYRAFAVPLRMPEGPMRGRTFYREIYALLDGLRQAGGDDSDFVLDCGGQLKASEAAGLADAFEPFHLLWLDEPTDEINRKAFSKIAAENVTPVGIGRTFSANAAFQDLLRTDSVDVLRPDIVRLGVGEIRKAAALAETYYVAVAPYHRGGPIGTAAALHAAASIPNFVIQEVPRPAAERDRTMRRELVGADLEAPQDGFLPLPEGHGLGIALNEDALEKYEVKS
jgi:galactonate dehydratase